MTVFTFGLCAFTGWMIANPNLISVFPNHIPISMNAAIGFIVIAIALGLREQSSSKEKLGKLGNILAALAILLGALTLIEYMFNINLSIDEMFSPTLPELRKSFDPKFPNRMAVYTALNFILNGLAIVFLDSETKSGRRPSQYLTLLSMIAPLQTILLYSYGAQSFLPLGHFRLLIQMALPNAICWILLSVSILYARPFVGMMSVLNSATPAGRYLRRLLIPAVIIPPSLGWFIASGGDDVTLYHPAYGASFLVLMSMVIFIFIVWKNGMEIFQLHCQKDQYLSELKAAKRQAEEANKAKSSFLANMSHEIRSPLGVMLGFAELMSNKNSTDEQRLQYAAMMKRNGQALTTIIDDILDLSKVEAGKLKIERRKVYIYDLVNDIALIHEKLACEKGISFRLEMAKNSPRVVYTDPVRLRQILSNLIGNAIKFTQQGEVILKMKFEKILANDKTKYHLIFEIWDTGLGISSEYVEKLFTPFMQADTSATRRFGGSGLGLVLSRRLARALEGDVKLERTELGHGSIFSLTIDCGDESQISYDDKYYVNNVNTTLFNQSPKDHLPHKRLAGLNILLVDDALDNQAYVKCLLEIDGANVDLACNGIEAIEKAMTKHYDVILMDIQMPQLDGLEATKTLRYRGYTRPIFALTAHAMKEDKEKSILAGCDGHLSKPIKREVLVSAIEQYREFVLH